LTAYSGISKTMTESKDWVTIKIPKKIRDKAKEDSDTYGEIMQAGLEGATSSSAKEELNVDKVAEQVVDLFTAEVWEPAEHGDIENSLKTIEERTGKLEKQLEQMGGGR